MTDRYRKAIGILVIFIIVLSLYAVFTGLFSDGGPGEHRFISIYGESVRVYGVGLYKNDSVSIASQGLAADFVTLVLGIPLLILSFYLSTKRSIRASLLLSGTLAYFLYTYTSYTFLWMYNRLFLVYIALMALSLYAFILSVISFDTAKLRMYFKQGIPVRFLAGYQFFLAFGVSLMWLGRIVPSIFSGMAPEGLEHYTTLVIQGMDLGIIVPSAVVSGILLLKRNSFGYLLSSIIIFKSITMLAAITAMMVNMVMHGVEMNLIEITVFSLFDILALTALISLLKNTASRDRIHS